MLRLLLTLVVVLAAQRFGLRGVVALLIMVVLVVAVLKGGRRRAGGRGV